MIGLLTGNITTTRRNPLIVNVAGVGYLVHTTQSVAGSVKELALFELLLTVSGIGPRTALSVIERGAHAIEKAVQESDVTFFTTIPRLGKKNAQKIIIELKNKLGGLKDLDLTSEESNETNQILEALLSMGFRRAEVLAAIKKLEPEDTTVEQKIRHALKVLGK